MRDGFKAGLPIAAASLLLAMSFGVLARPVMGTVAPVVMSALIFAGSAQFAALAVLSAGGGAGAAILAGVLLNARFVPMGVALAPSLSGRPLQRAAIGQAMVDASWAMASRGGGRFDPAFMVGATFPNYPAWVGGTAIGVLLGDVIGDPEKLGLDALFPAFFLALLATELGRGRRAVAAAVMGAAVALALAPITAPGIPVIAACSAVVIALWPDRERRAAS
jgi:4-azaleucine resistance transporter AzlC